MDWTTLKKGQAHLHIEYAETFTGNLYAYETRIRTQPSIEISFDLGQNLRKSGNPHDDARELAEGGLVGLKVVHINDKRLMQNALKVVGIVSKSWALTIKLDGPPHSFRVRPAFGADSLVLSVE